MEIVQITGTVNIPLDNIGDAAEVLGFVKNDENGQPMALSNPLSNEDLTLVKVYLSNRLADRIQDDMEHYKRKLIERSMAIKTVEIMQSFEGIIQTSSQTITLP